MASITQLPLATGAKQGETLILRSARNDRKQKSPRATAAEQSSEYLDLQRSSNAVYEMTAGKKGSVRLRLARFGRKQAPFYRIHVADSRCPRDGKFIEKIGYYDPRPGKDGEKRIAVNVERAKYWLSVGAQPSDTVRRLLSMAGLLQRPLVSEMPEPKKGGKGNVDARADSVEDKGK